MAGSLKIDNLTTDNGLTLTGGARSTPCTTVPGITYAGGTITIDLNAANNFEVGLANNATLANPTNIKLGQSGAIFVRQTLGSNTLSYGSYYKFQGNTAPTLSTAVNGIDVLTYYVANATTIIVDAITNLA
jgi:hypothetical protein